MYCGYMIIKTVQIKLVKDKYDKFITKKGRRTWDEFIDDIIGD